METAFRSRLPRASAALASLFSPPGLPASWRQEPCSKPPAVHCKPKIHGGGFNGSGLTDWPAYSNSKPQAMHFVPDAAKAGPVVNEEGLKELDAYFAWRRGNADWR